MVVELKLLKALQGDCIWLRYGNEKFTNIVIDSGPKLFNVKFRELVSKIKNKGENIDLLIFTHIDNDHIGGACEVFSDNEMEFDCIKKIWLNTATKICEHFDLKEYLDKDYSIDIHKVNQVYTPKVANDLINIISEKNIEVEQLVMVDNKKINLGDAEILILSPTKKELEDLVKNWSKDGINTSFSSESWNEVAIDTILKYDKFSKDTNRYNGSSIAFIFKYYDISIVLLGDAYSHTVADTLKDYDKNNKLDIDLIKLSHHGSSSNTNYDLLDKLKCTNYLVSTNGTNANPDKRTIARLVKTNENEKVNLYSNYNWWENKNYFTEVDQQKYIKTKIINRVELKSDMIKIKEGLLIGSE